MRRRISSSSARLLGSERKRVPLAEQQVVLTVPASFDEEARELTVQAARDAGIEKLTLLEEPAAAFYAWIAGHLSRSNKELFDGQTVLVCDVGGGTSDFTLVRVDREGDRVAIHSNERGAPSAARRRQSRPYHLMACRIEARKDAFLTPAQRVFAVNVPAAKERCFPKMVQLPSKLLSSGQVPLSSAAH